MKLDFIARYPRTVALIAGFASATGFAPLGLWPVTLICFAVLMALIASAPNGRGAFARGWLFGVGHFTLGVNWIAHAFDFQDAMPHWLGYVAVVLLSLYLAVYPAVATLLAWWVGRGSRGIFTLAFAGAWIATEYARATFFTGFAWNPLGAITVGLPTVHYAAWVGTYGLSGGMILVTGVIWWLGAWARDAVARVRGRDRWHVAAAVAAVGGLMLVYAGVPSAWPGGSAALAVREFGPQLRIVQPNVSQAQRHDSSFDEPSVQLLERYTGPPGREPRLILWPEAAVPYFLEEERFARERLAKLLGPHDVLLTGGDALIYDKAGRLVAARNSLFAMTPDSAVIARYDKAHLVPYGEYLPMRPLLTAIGLSRLVPGDLDFIPGPGPQSIALPGFGKVGVQICYEMVFSGQVVDRANRPDFIFNPSTDAWFGAWGPPQHLAQSRLRAVEEGVPVVRATPTGISAVIDADGRLMAALPLDKPGFIATRLPPSHPPTLFARHGNVIPLLLAALLALLAVAPRFKRR